MTRAPEAVVRAALDDLAYTERQLAECEALLRAGHRDVEGICLGIADWAENRRLILAELKRSSC